MNKEKTASNPRLLLLSCSRKKHSTPGLLPALERYDGPLFRVTNKFMRGNLREAKVPDMYILSSRFGLIPACKPISYYDRRVTSQRVKELEGPVLTELEQILQNRRYYELFISMGKNYMQALRGYEPLIPPNLKVTISTGGMGRKQAELRNWLHGEPRMSLNNQTKPVQQGKANLRGIEIAFTPEQIMDVACLGLTAERNLPRYQVWFVPIGHQRIPVKWLVNQMTGLPVNSFHTDEARRVLQQLGIEVYSRG